MWLDTFNEMRKKSGMSLDAISEKSGVPKGTLAKITSGITKAPPLETMRKLVYSMGYTLDDLDRGLNSSENFSKKEKDHIKKYRSLDTYGKEAVDSILDIEAVRCAAQPQQDQPTSEDITNTIIYVDPAAAGSPLYAESNFERMSFPSSRVPKGTDFGIRISGNSMEPTIHNGDIAWVHKKTDLEDGDVGIFMINDSAACKRFRRDGDGTICLESDNPLCDPVHVSEGDTVILVGEVIGSISGEGI